MRPAEEKRLKEIVRPILLEGRNGDWEHTLRALEFGRYLLQNEPADEDIVITTLYLHDIGWSRIDFSDFIQASPARKKETQSLALHMQQGALLADGLLQDMGYDPEIRRHIVAIIAVHDEPEKIFAMNDPSATMVVEADRLDRYGQQSMQRYLKMFGPDYTEAAAWQEGKALRLDGLNSWFKTPTARALAHKLAVEMKLFD
jgi:uncharacterized protein